MHPTTILAGLVAAVLAAFGVTAIGADPQQPPQAEKLPPPPVVTYPPATAPERIEHGERIVDVDQAKRELHAQHHPHQVLETRQVPGIVRPAPAKTVDDLAITSDELVVINPGPGEYVRVMEGQRHGFENLTVGITYTAPGGAPPMHTHPGEEAHVLLEGDILYALGDELFTISAPYIVHIPPMTPHSFVNTGDSLAELVVIFPTNVWEYDVLDYFPFKDLEAAKQRAKKVQPGSGPAPGPPSK